YYYKNGKDNSVYPVKYINYNSNEFKNNIYLHTFTINNALNTHFLNTYMTITYDLHHWSDFTWYINDTDYKYTYIWSFFKDVNINLLPNNCKNALGPCKNDNNNNNCSNIDPSNGIG